MDNDPIVNGFMAQGLDSEYWHRVSLISYIDSINVPIHITGTFNDEQTGARGHRPAVGGVAPWPTKATPPVERQSRHERHGAGDLGRSQSLDGLLDARRHSFDKNGG